MNILIIGFIVLFLAIIYCFIKYYKIKEGLYPDDGPDFGGGGGGPGGFLGGGPVSALHGGRGRGFGGGGSFFPPTPQPPEPQPLPTAPAAGGAGAGTTTTGAGTTTTGAGTTTTGAGTTTTGAGTDTGGDNNNNTSSNNQSAKCNTPVPPGYYCASGSSSPTACTGNQYCPIADMTRPLLCSNISRDLSGSGPLNWGNTTCKCIDPSKIMKEEINGTITCVTTTNTNCTNGYSDGTDCICNNGYYKHYTTSTDDAAKCNPVNNAFLLAPDNTNCSDVNASAITNKIDCINALSWLDAVAEFDISFSSPSANGCAVQTSSAKGTSKFDYVYSMIEDGGDNTNDTSTSPGWQKLCHAPTNPKFSDKNIKLNYYPSDEYMGSARCQEGYMLGESHNNDKPADNINRLYTSPMDVSCLRCGTIKGTNSDCTLCNFDEGSAEGWRSDSDWNQTSQYRNGTKNCYTCPAGTHATGPPKWQCIQCSDYTGCNVNVNEQHAYPLLLGAQLPMSQTVAGGYISKPNSTSDSTPGSPPTDPILKKWTTLESKLYNNGRLLMPKPSLCRSTSGSKSCNKCTPTFMNPALTNSTLDISNLLMMDIYDPSRCTWKPGINPNQSSPNKSIALCPLGEWSNANIASYPDPSISDLSYNSRTECIPYPSGYYKQDYTKDNIPQSDDIVVGSTNLTKYPYIPSTGYSVLHHSQNSVTPYGWNTCNNRNCPEGSYLPQLNITEIQEESQAGKVCKPPQNGNNPCFFDYGARYDPSENFYCQEAQYNFKNNIQKLNPTNGHCIKPLHIFSNEINSNTDVSNISVCVRECLNNSTECKYVGWDKSKCYVFPYATNHNGLLASGYIHDNLVNLYEGSINGPSMFSDLCEGKGSTKDISFVDVDLLTNSEPGGLSYDISWGANHTGNVIGNIAKCSCRGEDEDYYNLPEWKKSPDNRVWIRKFDDDKWHTELILDSSSNTIIWKKGEGQSKLETPVCYLEPPPGIIFTNKNPQ